MKTLSMSWPTQGSVILLAIPQILPGCITGVYVNLQQRIIISKLCDTSESLSNISETDPW